MQLIKRLVVCSRFLSHLRVFSRGSFFIVRVRRYIYVLRNVHDFVIRIGSVRCRTTTREVPSREYTPHNEDAAARLEESMWEWHTHLLSLGKGPLWWMRYRMYVGTDRLYVNRRATCTHIRSRKFVRTPQSVRRINSFVNTTILSVVVENAKVRPSYIDEEPVLRALLKKFLHLCSLPSQNICLV